MVLRLLCALVALLAPRAASKTVLDSKSVFKNIDADGDGAATHEELVGYLRDNKAEGFQARHDGVMDAQRRRIASLVSALDVDKDNHVSHGEFPGKASFADKATFDEADENKDGRLSAGEIITHQAGVHSPQVMMYRAALKVFGRADEDESGALTHAELEKHIGFFQQHTMHEEF
jgi:Ca2+-binding EF-hand superfamily protein